MGTLPKKGQRRVQLGQSDLERASFGVDPVGLTIFLDKFSTEASGCVRDLIQRGLPIPLASPDLNDPEWTRWLSEIDQWASRWKLNAPWSRDVAAATLSEALRRGGSADRLVWASAGDGFAAWVATGGPLRHDIAKGGFAVQRAINVGIYASPVVHRWADVATRARESFEKQLADAQREFEGLIDAARKLDGTEFARARLQEVEHFKWLARLVAGERAYEIARSVPPRFRKEPETTYPSPPYTSTVTRGIKAAAQALRLDITGLLPAKVASRPDSEMPR